MYIYGIHPVLNFIKYKKSIVRKVYCTQENYRKYLKDIYTKAVIIDSKELKKITNVEEHQGIIAEISKFPYVNFEDYINNARKICILDHIENPRNLGAIIRNALAFKIDLIIIPEKRACEVNATVIKASAGSAAIVPITIVNNINNAIRNLKENGFWIYGLEATGNLNLRDVKFDPKSVIVLGSEGKGIHELTKKLCDYLVFIETEKDVSSLNVSSASAIVFYKIYSQDYVA